MTPKLLLADDSVTIQRVIELTFADENIQVVAVGDGRQAIDRVLADRPDIVLADVGMPERDGYEVAAFIKGQPQLAHIPVLLLTGAFEPVDEARARSVGCDGVLVKPFEPQMVISRVRDLLSGRRSAPHTNATPAPAEARPPDQPAVSTPASIEALTDASGPADGGSLEDYFDRLDAALATLGPGGSPPSTPTLEPIVAPPQAAPFSPRPPSQGPAAVPPPPARPAMDPDPLGGWDPDLAVGQSAAVPPPAAGSPPAEPGAATYPPSPSADTTAPAASVPRLTTVAPAVPSAPAGSGSQTGGPSLTDAFAALLAAEQGHPVPVELFAPAAPAAPTISDQLVDEIAARVIARMGDESMRRAVLDAAERLVREEIDRIKQASR
ncbi:MAG TPA: response regulator [Vicinamibacterales bacterium]|nr:response regulator [Vicinamibacterales bacterium]